MLALAGKSFSLTDIRAMTMPEADTYIRLLTGKPAPGGSGDRRLVPARRKGAG